MLRAYGLVRNRKRTNRIYREEGLAGTYGQGHVFLVEANRRESPFYPAGQADQNASVESFNGKFREYCLNQHWIASLADARSKI
jgi:hypothetical protein